MYKKTEKTKATKTKILKQLKQSKGITLIALIITIIVLLILAGVTIAQIAGNDSAANKAVEARTKNDQGAEFDAIKLATVSAIAEGDYNLYVNAEALKRGLEGVVEEDSRQAITATNYPWTVIGKTTTMYEITRTGEVEAVDPPVLVSETDSLITVNVESFAALKGYEKLPSTTKNLKAIKNAGQSNEQQMIVPAGFTVVEGNKLEDGMVIRDVTYTNTNGSEFVWVPVGQILTFAGTQGTGTITLSRYSFDSNTGAATAKDPTTIISPCYTENATSFTATDNKTHQATVARTVTNNNVTEIEFVKQAIANKGYYIGRFEAGLSGTENNNSLTTKTAVDGSVKPVTIAGRGVWNKITRDNAKTVSQGMYTNDTSKFKSELLTSYAWDTAVVFIQKCGNNATYSKQNSFNTGLPTTTGSATKNGVNDVQCNIYDMASNVGEWTTEYSSDSGDPCVNRGGRYDYSTYYVRSRGRNDTSASNNNYGFRPLLYIM
ncbi:MAG: hypothetical protein IJH76_02890 [Clostridia bacterium]|nr:hypothetical protein [Clostridia bacterium]